MRRMIRSRRVSRGNLDWLDHRERDEAKGETQSKESFIRLDWSGQIMRKGVG